MTGSRGPTRNACIRSGSEVHNVERNARDSAAPSAIFGSCGLGGVASVVRSAADYDDALSEASEGGESVGAALDDLDRVDHAFGVAVPLVVGSSK